MDKLPSRAFFVRVKDDSMASNDPDCSFPPGTYLAVDPDRLAENQSFVVAFLPDANEQTFRQLVIGGERRYLKPLNPRYPLIACTERTEIVGVVFFTGRSLIPCD